MKYKQFIRIEHSHAAYQWKAKQNFDLVCLVAFCFVEVTIYDIEN